MSHLNFVILTFSTNFCPFKIDLSGNTIWPQASVFQKPTKMDIFWRFWWTFVHWKCKRSSLRSQCWMRLFLWFSNTVRQHLLCMHKKQALLQVFDEYFVRNAFSEGYSLYPILLRPKSRGQISLRSSDPQDYPKIQPNYLTHPDDVKVLVEGLFLGNNECILMHLWSGLLASSRFPFHSKLTVKFFLQKMQPNSTHCYC